MRLVRAPRGTAKMAHVSAPIGGLNTVDAAFGMPESDCPLLYNLIAAEYGLRSRLGWQEWCTGLTGISDNTVRSVLPFAGSASSGSNDKLFATTSKGIYDVSASSGAPTLLVTFGTQSGKAGYGVSTVVVNSSGGHFLAYCDEENGYYVYTEATTTWTKVVQASSTAWVTATIVAAGAYVSNAGLTYHTVAGGTTGANAPTGTAAGISDGGVTWDYAPSINGVDPATLVFCIVWKNRLWFVQKNTGKAWYLQIGFGAGGSLYGTATSFNFGAQFGGGGALVGLYNWTQDSGTGPDDRLVAVSSAGDVVIYEGTDPASAGSFGIKGRYSVGGVPAGRRIATRYGGDLLILSSTGIVPTSTLSVGRNVDATSYSTYKISNAFNRLAATYRSLDGWAMCIHPEDNSLVVAVPTASGQNTVQLASNLTTKGWSQYRDLPLLSMDAWNGKMYFGTADGRVCINTGYLDGLLLSDASAYTPIDCSLVTRFTNLGRGTQKQITLIRPTVTSEGGSVQGVAEARYRFDLSEAARPTSTIVTVGDAKWDSAIWDSSRWGGAYATQQQAGGAVGMGPDAAIAYRFAATARTVLVGFDIEFIEGGTL